MPPTNRDTQAATDYHNASKYVSVLDANGGEVLVFGSPPDPDSAAYVQDPALRPLPYKIYETLAPIPLPREFPPTTLPALEAISRTGTEPDQTDAMPDLAALARIALLSNGLLGRTVATSGGWTIEYRTAGGTGALYHLELYFVCADLPDLAAGVYHYAVHDHSLRQLRAGDFRQVLVAASGAESAVASAPITMVVTSTVWRNAWYYRVRAYRHTYWDSGTTLAHAFATAAALGLPADLVLGYADGPVNDLLGVDGVREAAVALCPLGRSGAPMPLAPALPPLHYPTRPISASEHSFSAITAMHRASALLSGADAAAWRASRLRRVADTPEGLLTPLQSIPDDALPPTSLDDLVFRRRSTRHYDSQTPIAFAAFSTVLDRSSRGVAADCLAPGSLPLHDLYLIIHNVEGLTDGIYLHHPELHAVELLRAGTFRDRASRIAVDQEYAGAAHVNCYYLTDLTPVLERYGNRGYRLAQLESALSGGKLQLAAHALGLGTVGSTSYDDEVVACFSPHASGKSYMFVAVFGAKRRRSS